MAIRLGNGTLGREKYPDFTRDFLHCIQVNIDTKDHYLHGGIWNQGRKWRHGQSESLSGYNASKVAMSSPWGNI